MFSPKLSRREANGFSTVVTRRCGSVCSASGFSQQTVPAPASKDRARIAGACRTCRQ